jgi:hypothetical protein
MSTVVVVIAAGPHPTVIAAITPSSQLAFRMETPFLNFLCAACLPTLFS